MWSSIPAFHPINRWRRSKPLTLPIGRRSFCKHCLANERRQLSCWAPSVGWMRRLELTLLEGMFYFVSFFSFILFVFLGSIKRENGRNKEVETGYKRRARGKRGKSNSENIRNQKDALKQHPYTIKVRPNLTIFFLYVLIYPYS